MATDIIVMAENVYKSHLFPVASVEQAATLMMIAESEGVHPMKALAMYDLIPGKPPRLKATEMQARFCKNGGEIKWVKRTDTECVLWGKHPVAGELEVTWTIERAKNAGLTNKDNWKKYPAQMLASKAIAELVRALYPECLNGMYNIEECNEVPAQEPQDANNAVEVHEQKESKAEKKAQENEVIDAVVVDSEEGLKQAVSELNEQDELYRQITEEAWKIREDYARKRAFAWLDKAHSISDCKKMLKRCKELVANQNKEVQNG